MRYAVHTLASVCLALAARADVGSQNYAEIGTNGTVTLSAPGPAAVYPRIVRRPSAPPPLEAAPAPAAPGPVAVTPDGAMSGPVVERKAVIRRPTTLRIY